LLKTLIGCSKVIIDAFSWRGTQLITRKSLIYFGSYHLAFSVICVFVYKLCMALISCERRLLSTILSQSLFLPYLSKAFSWSINPTCMTC